MFVHPHCPCSRASLAELEVLATECQGRIALRVVFVRPPGCAEGWQRTRLWDAAERIPGTVVSCDANGIEAGRFRATTSGETLLYSPAGQLLFQGGLTRSRGHRGDNPGRSAIAALIEGKQADQCRMPTYGCSLSNQVQCVEETIVRWDQ